MKNNFEAAKQFENHFINNIMPVYGEGYFRAGIKNYKFENIIYEVLFKNSIHKLHPNYDYFSIPASYSEANQPNTVFYLNNKNIKFVHIKYTPDIVGNGPQIREEFDNRYQDTDYCILAFPDYFLVQENIYDEQANFKERKRIMTVKTLLPFDAEINASEITNIERKTTIDQIKIPLKHINEAADTRKNDIIWKPVHCENGVRKLPNYSSENFNYSVEYSEEAMKNKEKLIKELNLNKKS